MENITYKVGVIPQITDIIEVYDDSGIRRPTTDIDRIEKMYANSNLVITAWSENRLIGISRSMTDFCYACYLSDLAVRKDYQGTGIGKGLIDRTKNEISRETALILLSAPSAMDYYPKVGFKEIRNGFIIPRSE